MKTYILNGLDRLKQYSKQLDAKAVLYNKNWEIFNEKGEKEVLIFRSNNELLIVQNGIVQKSKWELLSANSILIENSNCNYLLKTAFANDNFLALQLDGTNEYMLLIEEEAKRRLILDTIANIENYLNTIANPKELNSDTINVKNESRFFSEEELKIMISIYVIIIGVIIAIAIGKLIQ